ncbi:serine hydrolase [Streptomyces sp. NBC_00122]|uniref:serine hydrolase n=1 Tax=Streptomyces sp. NBC_00122 TaxID=2903623 RepID=UPI003869C605
MRTRGRVRVGWGPSPIAGGSSSRQAYGHEGLREFRELRHPQGPLDHPGRHRSKGGMVSNAPDLERFMAALLRGRLLKSAQQRQLFTMPALSEGNVDRYSMSGMMRAEADGAVVWGKTGSMGPSTSGVFATERGGRTVVYSLVPAPNDRAQMRVHLGRLITAALWRVQPGGPLWKDQRHERAAAESVRGQPRPGRAARHARPG